MKTRPHLSFIIPPALDVDALRNALAAAELPAKVGHPERDFIKVKPSKGQSWQVLNAFVKGFIAGFGA